METHITRYGVQKNPYYVERVRSFDPKDIFAPLIPIDGFRDLEPEGALVKFLKDRVAAAKPAYVLVRGSNGIGRTAAARCILKRYCDVRGAGLLITPEVELNNDPHDVLLKWLGPLYTELLNKIGKLDDAITNGFDKVLDSREFDQKFKTNAQNLLIQIDRHYGSGQNPIVFGFCLEDPPEKFPIVDVIRALFWQVRTVVVLVLHTNIDEDVEERNQREEGILDPVVRFFVELSQTKAGWIFPRSKLAVADIKLLAAGYWERAKPGVKCPIEPDSIEVIGGLTPLPLISVLSVLEEALEETARSSGEGFWPDDIKLQVCKPQRFIKSGCKKAQKQIFNGWIGIEG
jgi:hypothetical protein